VNAAAETDEVPLDLRRGAPTHTTNAELWVESWSELVRLKRPRPVPIYRALDQAGPPRLLRSSDELHVDEIRISCDWREDWFGIGCGAQRCMKLDSAGKELDQSLSGLVPNRHARAEHTVYLVHSDPQVERPARRGRGHGGERTWPRLPGPMLLAHRLLEEERHGSFNHREHRSVLEECCIRKPRSKDELRASQGGVDPWPASSRLFLAFREEVQDGSHTDARIGARLIHFVLTEVNRQLRVACDEGEPTSSDSCLPMPELVGDESSPCTGEVRLPVGVLAKRIAAELERVSGQVLDAAPGRAGRPTTGNRERMKQRG
jgi:hypothetical protein